MIYLAIAVPAVLLVLAVLAVASGWAGRVRYSWRRSRHVLAGGPPPWSPLPPSYGSMDLDAELALGTHLPAYLAAPPDPLPLWGTVASGWREQTAADLAPEALEDALMTSTDDSGPGSSLAPGPDVPWTSAGREGAGTKTECLAYEPGPGHTAYPEDAGLAAEVAAWLRAQDDDTALYCSQLRSACAQVRLDLAAALA